MAVAPTSSVPPSANGQFSSDAFSAGQIALLLNSFVAPTRIGGGGGGGGGNPCEPWPACVTNPTPPTFPGLSAPGGGTTAAPGASAGDTQACIREKCGIMCVLFPNIGPAGCKECIANCKATVGTQEAPGLNLGALAPLLVIVVGIILLLVALALVIK